MSSDSRRLGISLAWPITIPIFAGFIFLGLAYGLYATGLGLPWYLPILMSSTIFAGSMEFLAATLLFSPFDPLGALLRLGVGALGRVADSNGCQSGAALADVGGCHVLSPSRFLP